MRLDFTTQRVGGLQDTEKTIAELVPKSKNLKTKFFLLQREVWAKQTVKGGRVRVLAYRQQTLV